MVKKSGKVQGLIMLNTIYKLHISFTGISLNGLTLELFSYSTTMLYNFTNNYALLTYLEYPILLLQEYALIYYVLKYEKLMGSKNVKYTLIAYLVFVSGFGIGLLPKSILIFLIVSMDKSCVLIVFLILFSIFFSP
jgi:solute carrier family 66, member 3